MKKTLGIALLTVLLLSASTMAFQYFYADNDAYWILEDPVVGYSVEVPSKGYVYQDKVRYGERTVEIPLKENGPTLTVTGIKGTSVSVDTARKSLVDYWNRLLTGIKVEGNQTLTTSKGVAATFYAMTGTAPSGQTVMVRVILYQRGRDLVYITYTLEEKEYTGDLRQYWLQAVNTFQWK